MVVAILSNDHAWTYNLRKEVIQGILNNGHRVVLLLSYGDKIDNLCEMGCEFIDVPYERHSTNPIKEINLCYHYYKHLKRIKPDIVLTYTIKPNIYGGIICRLLKIPFIPNVTGLGPVIESKNKFQKFAILLYKLALKKAKVIFFQNKENQEFMYRHRMVSGNSCLLPGSGVNLNRFVPQQYPPDDVVSFAFVGRVVKEKGIDQYLEAARVIREKYPNTVFNVCGFCENEYYKEKIDAMANQGVIVYHGMVDDMSEIYSKIHCTVLPTFYPEGLSNVLLESLASGRPIITTDRAGCREVVDDGINGFVCKQRDSADLIKQIEKFISLPYEVKMKMGLAGRAKIEKEYDRNIVVKAYLREIESI